ncbi:MAG TPA: AAC(3) family N-acetyltransferase, partial [Myxococcales bacterium]
TTLHLAEALAKVPYSVEHPCVVMVDGEARTIPIAETDHCCRRFEQMDEWLRGRATALPALGRRPEAGALEAGLQREGEVGHAHARLAESQDVVREALRRLRADPLVFLCPAAEGCAECDLARASIATA